MTDKRREALVVDDNDLWLEILTRLTKDSGYYVFTAHTCDEAMLKVKQSQSAPDLVVTDVRLRDDDESNIDGLRLLLELEKRQELRSSIVVTGYPDDKTRKIAQRLGATYMEKHDFDREDFWRAAGKPKRIATAQSNNTSPLLPCRAMAAV